MQLMSNMIYGIFYKKTKNIHILYRSEDTRVFIMPFMNKTIVASNNAPILCAASEQLRRRLAFVALLTKYATISVPAAEWAKQSLSWNNGNRFSSGSQPYKH